MTHAVDPGAGTGIREHLDGDRGERLLGAVRALGVPVGHERSLKLTAGEIRPDRFLLTLHKSSLGERAQEVVLAVTRSLGLPPAREREIGRALEPADLIHFGHEGTLAGPVRKIYLEYASAARAALERRDRGPVLVHHALKWDARGRCATSFYRCEPALTPGWIPDRIEAAFRGVCASSRAVADVLAIGLARAPAERFLFMSVEEEGSARHSFDLNLYDAGLAVNDIMDLLCTLGGDYSLPARMVEDALGPVRERPLGHVSGGLDARGVPFVTIYFGVTDLDPAR